MSVNTILSATQMNIIADDLIDIDGKCKAVNVPFEQFELTDLGSGSARAGWRGHYLQSSNTDVDLEYLITVTSDGGSASVWTDLVCGSTTACQFGGIGAGTSTFQGVKDLDGVVSENGGDDVFIYLQAHNSTDAVNATQIKWLSQLKTANAGYESFSASRFRDGDTSTVDDQLAILRTDIANVNGYAKRGVAGFKARESGYFESSASKVLFHGYVNSIGPGSSLYMVLGFMFDNSHGTNRVVRVKTTFDGTDLADIDWTVPGWVGYSNLVTTACTLSCAAATYDVNDKCEIVVGACTTANDADNDDGKAQVMLMYLAEVPSGSRADWVSPPTFTSGCYVLGHSACPSASPQWLSAAASNIEALAGDTGRGGYGTDEQDAATLPVGRARAIYRLPVHRAGQQYGTDFDSSTPGVVEGKYQRIYSIRTGETAYVRARNAILKYGPAASPLTHEVDDFTATAEYDTINMDNIGDLEYGMLYYVETELPTDAEGATSPSNIMADYLEERFS